MKDRQRELIRLEICSLGAGAVFTAREIRESLKAKGTEVDPRKITAELKYGQERYLGVVAESYGGKTYKVLRMPKYMPKGYDEKIQE